MKYRVIDAPGWGISRDNKVRIYGHSATAEAARKSIRKGGHGVLIQENIDGQFNPEDEWDWRDWAHEGGINAGFLRNL